MCATQFYESWLLRHGLTIIVTKSLYFYAASNNNDFRTHTNKHDFHQGNRKQYFNCKLLYVYRQHTDVTFLYQQNNITVSKQQCKFMIGVCIGAITDIQYSYITVCFQIVDWCIVLFTYVMHCKVCSCLWKR